MEGYKVVTSDDHTVGHVVERKGDILIVEHGHLRKSRHAVPCATVEIDDGEQQVRTSLSKGLIESSPKIENGSIDEQAVAEHYGLGFDSTAPATEGYGVTERTDPARSAEQDSGMTEPAEQERARIQKGDDRAGLPEESPAFLGDRVSGIDEREQRD
jgi:hypothetical protein